MRKYPTAVAIIVLVWVALAAPAPVGAQGRTAVVEGTFIFYDGEPMKGIIIAFKGDDGEIKGQAVTDAEGKFRVENLDVSFGARFTVQVLVAGKNFFELTDFTPGTSDVNVLKINLQDEARKQKMNVTPEKAREMRKGVEGRQSHAAMQGYFKRGVEFLEKEDFASAARELEVAASLDDTQHAIFGRLGVAYRMTGQVGKGIAAYKRAIELKPDEGGFYNNIGQLYLENGQTEEAMAAFQKAAEADPDNASMFYYNLGVTLFNANELADATEPFRRAAELEPKRADAHYFLGMCLLNQIGSRMEGNNIILVLKPGTREALQSYLKLAPEGKYAAEVEATLIGIKGAEVGKTSGAN